MSNSAEAAPESTQETGPRPRKRRLWLWLAAATAVAVAGWLMSIEIALWRGEVCLESRCHARALAWLQAASWLGADRRADVHFLLARCYRRLERFDEVQPHRRRALELGWDVKQVEREQWLALAQTRHYDEVNPHWAALFENPGSDGPEISKAFVTAALAWFRFNEALRVLDAWQADYPDDPEPHVILGQLAEAKLDWAEALKVYRRALELQPNRTDARLGLARALITMGEAQTAEAHLDQVVRETPNDLEARLVYAQCLGKLDRADEARQRLLGILQEQPDHVDTLLELGNLELVAGRPDEALKHLQRCAKLKPENRGVVYAYVKALRAAGRGQEAARYSKFVEEATPLVTKLPKLINELLLHPDDKKLRFQVAYLTWKYRSRDEGEKWFRSLLKFDPNHAPTHAALAIHYRLAGDAQRAADHQRRAVGIDVDKLMAGKSPPGSPSVPPSADKAAAETPGANQKGAAR